MTPEELRALIGEVEAFQPDYAYSKTYTSDARALADRCLLAMGWTIETIEDDVIGREQVWITPTGEFHGSRPNPLLSIDDADALLPEGYSLKLCQRLPDNTWIAVLFQPLNDEIETERPSARAYTEPCARTAAALRAELRRVEG